MRTLRDTRDAHGQNDKCKTCRLWLAIDMVTTKLDKSMGGTVGGEG